MANICQCPTPPGGQATCGDDQIAICRIVNGQAQTECLDVAPISATSLTQDEFFSALSKVFSSISGKSMKVVELSAPEVSLAMIGAGTYGNASFTLPRTFKDEVIAFLRANAAESAA